MPYNGNSKLYEFGRFRVDTGQGFLLRNGKLVHLPPKALELLIFLLENPNQVIDKETLMQEVWNGSFVEDSNLVVHISNLRKIFAEDGNGSAKIETFPKRGYRLIADISQPPNSEAAPAGAVSEKRVGLWVGSAVILGFALIFVLAAIWPFRFSSTTGSDKAPTVSRLTNIGTVTESNISPDGKLIAYSRTEQDGRFSISLKVIGEQSETQVLPPTEGSCFGISFMPDGKSIVYSGVDRDRKPASYLMPLFGGNSVKTQLNYETLVAYSPDGTRKAYMDGQLSQGLNFLMIANADSSDTRILATRENPHAFSLRGPIAWSPDGRQIAAVKADPGGYQVAVIDAETGEDTGAEKGAWYDISGIAWLPDMTGVLIAATELSSSISQVWRISMTDGSRTRITNDTNQYFRANLSSDGKTFVTQEKRAPSSIWVAPVSGLNYKTDAVTIDSASAIKVSSSLADGDLVDGVEWAPNGGLVFVSQDGGNRDIWTMNADGTGRKQLTTDTFADTSPTVSPDGKIIAFNSTRTGKEVIWLMDIDGQNQRQITDGKINRRPVFHPDGKWIYFRSWESGVGTVWRLPVDGGPPEQVLSEASGQPQISADGIWLLYLTRDPSTFAFRPREGGAVVKTFQPAPHDRFGASRWLPSSNAFSYVMEKDGLQQIWLQSLDGSPPRQLTNFPENVNSYAWSRDGKKIAVALGTTTTDVIMMKMSE